MKVLKIQEDIYVMVEEAIKMNMEFRKLHHGEFAHA